MRCCELVIAGLVSMLGAGCAQGGGWGGAEPGPEVDTALGPALSDTAECLAAAAQHTSVGCAYWAVDMDGRFAADDGCFVAFVANTSRTSARIEVTFDEQPIDLAVHAKQPVGSGPALGYGPFVPEAGLPPGEVAILFLAGQYAEQPQTGDVIHQPLHCPVPAAVETGAQIHGTGIGRAFHIETSMPVVAYQMLPYGGGRSAVTGATLLLPTSAWDTSYLGVNAYGDTASAWGLGPSMNIVAAEDDTVVTIVPRVDLGAGPGVTPAAAGQAVSHTLARGQVLQLTQGEELTGSPVSADKPIGLLAGHQCANTPLGVQYCDHAEQQIPPLRALGHAYVAAAHRRRTGATESTPYRIIGAADGTLLSYTPPIGGPSSLQLGEVVELRSSVPFVVRSQDANHPFLVLAYMTGADEVGQPLSSTRGYGDPDVVRIIPPEQYLDRYVFFTDPSYPETNLVVVRKRTEAGFAEVVLDCAGTLDGWQPVGSDYQLTRIDLVRHDFEPQGGCNTGRREMYSAAPFGLWVWGWGGPETQGGSCDEHQPGYSCYVSYAYPAGEGLGAINGVDLPPPR